MGHDIYGFKTNPENEEVEDHGEIAYLRRSAFNDDRNRLYELLDAKKHNCGCSGCGESERFSLERLQAARSQCAEEDDLSEFLDRLIEHAKTEGEPYIAFW